MPVRLELELQPVLEQEQPREPPQEQIEMWTERRRRMMSWQPVRLWAKRVYVNTCQVFWHTTKITFVTITTRKSFSLMLYCCKDESSVRILPSFLEVSQGSWMS